jgi:hypothetical protein
VGDSSSEPSSSSSSDGSSKSGSSSEETSSEESNCSEEEERRHKGKKSRKAKEKEDDWQLLEEMWPLEARPAKLQSRKVVGRWSIEKIMEFKKQYEQEAERQGVGIAVFGRDKKRRAKRYKEMKDDGESKLHPARFERLPFSDPEKYWKKMPVKREEIYRHIKLDHYGAQVGEATIVRLHDRRVTVELDMFLRGNVLKGSEKAGEVADVRRLQEAVANYACVMQVLWPLCVRMRPSSTKPFTIYYLVHLHQSIQPLYTTSLQTRHGLPLPPPVLGHHLLCNFNFNIFT